jgi:hypothetical protein
LANFKVEAHFEYNDNIAQNHLSHQSGSGLLWDDDNTAQGGNPSWDGNTAQSGGFLWDGNIVQSGDPLWDGNIAQSNGFRSDDGFTLQTHNPVDTNTHQNNATGIPFGDGTLLLDSNLFPATLALNDDPLTGTRATDNDPLTGTRATDNDPLSAPPTTDNDSLIDPLDQVHSGWIGAVDHSTNPAVFLDPFLTAFMKSPDIPGNQGLLVLNNDGSSQSINLADPNLLRFGDE